VSNIEKVFTELKERGEKAFIPFITAGDPTLDITEALVLELEKAGADIIEFGVPFSDPLADGPVNQEAAQRALLNDVSLETILGCVKSLRTKTQIPILLFTYYNPVLAYGADKLAQDGKNAGIDGILCVDLPPEEAVDYRKSFHAAGLDTVFLLAPTSTDERAKVIAEASSGFIYYVSRTGVTGEQSSIESSVEPMVEKIKQHTDIPIAVGFGISTPEQAKEIAGFGDAVVVGSAIVRMVGELGDTPETASRVGTFVKTLVDATKGRV
jgi:tryptophan synthase alpha chain